MRQFYIPELSKHDNKLVLSQEESKHISRVLRMKVGDKIELLNGNGIIADAEITDNNQKATCVKLLDIQVLEKPKQEIHIAIAPTKNNDRLEWFLEKSTEIGVDKISLILTDNAERKVVKMERLEKILVSAMKQSKRGFLPKLIELQKLTDFIKENPNGLIAHCYNGEKKTIAESIKPTNCPIIIGPEGDFSENEVSTAFKNNYKAITLGENRLRTETAGLYAVTVAKLTLT